MSARLEIARELGSAGLDLLATLPRQAWACLRRRARLREFEHLQASPLAPAEGPSSLEAGGLRRLVLSCGDASGELHALRLLEELRRRHPEFAVEGFGGSRLAASGMEVWEPLADLNVMGFRDVLARLPLFMRCVRRFVDTLEARRPDAVVLVDYPGLNRHLLRIAARAGVPVVDHIAPQLWAWAPWRVRDFRRSDRLTTILPFEADWFRRRGADPIFVGHPLGDGLASAAREEAAPPPLEEDRVWIGILPGSRRREIRGNLPPLLAAAARLADHRSDVAFVLPHLRPDRWPLIDGLLEDSPVEVRRAPGCFHAVLPRLQAAWVASGTALLEVAAHRVPPVLVYALDSWLAGVLAARLLTVPHVGSLNLIAGERLIPEHVSHRLDAGHLAADLEALLEGPGRARVLAGIDRHLGAFGRPGTAARTARVVEAAIAEGRARKGLS